MFKSIFTVAVLLVGLGVSLILVKEAQIFVQKASEGPVSTVSGVLTYEVIEGNPKTNTPSSEKYYLILKDGSKILVDSSLVGNSKVGSIVTIQGITRSDGSLSFSDIQRTGSYTISAPKTVTGSRKVAVILVNFSDKTMTTPTKAAVQSLISGQFKNFYDTSSYGKFTLNVTNSDVYGPYTINPTYACSSSTYTNIYLSALSLADQDINYYNYRYDLGNGMLGVNVIFVFPSDSTCGLNGFANSNFKSTNDGAFTFQMSYIPSNVFGLRAVAHEFGHNLGLKHAAGKDCGISKYPGTCTDYEYADPWDMMGAWNYDSSPQVPDTARDFSASRKEDLGWLNSSNTQIITNTGDYDLYPLENSTSNIKALKIKANSNSSNQDYYYIENRFPPSGNIDSGIETSAINGIIYRLVTPSGTTFNSSLFDMTPNSVSGITADFKDTAMAVGSDASLAMPGGPYDNGIVVVLNSKSQTTGKTSIHVALGQSNPPTPSSYYDTQRCWDRSALNNSTYYWSDACTGIFSLYTKTSSGRFTCSITSFRAPPQLSSSELTQRNNWNSAGSPRTPCQN